MLFTAQPHEVRPPDGHDRAAAQDNADSLPASCLPTRRTGFG
jgi:hypothetical protein